jgi:hypothetical protein
MLNVVMPIVMAPNCGVLPAKNKVKFLTSTSNKAHQPMEPLLKGKAQFS